MSLFPYTRLVRCSLIVAFLAILFQSHGVQLQPGFVAQTLAKGLNSATAIAPLPDGRILIAEQTGRLLVWKGGRVLKQPALELSVTDFWERGLIGVTPHPRFPEVDWIYVLYVAEKPFVHHVLSRFRMQGDQVDPSSEEVLLKGDDQSTFGGFQKAGHQGGVIRFGNDGKLYISIGEQTAGKPAQDLKALQGKILRINDDGSIPTDNPFLDKTTGKYQSIYAIGVRNAFGLAIQPPVDGGRMFFTDVGSNKFEEINELTKGGNYGWPAAEGLSEDKLHTQPIHHYPPTVGRCIAGGTFYPENPSPSGAFPEKWRGKFFFVDWAQHWIKAIDPTNPEKALSFASGLDGAVAIEALADGSLLVLNRATIWRDPKKVKKNTGSIVQIRYQGMANADTTIPPAALGFPGTSDDLPEKLSSLPFFSDLHTAVTQRKPFRTAGRDVVLEYELNAEPFEPGVIARRWVVLPQDRKLSYAPTRTWDLPEGALLIRHYSRETDGSPLETRFLAAHPSGNHAVAYEWMPDRSDATRVDDPGFIELSKDHYWLVPAPEPLFSFGVSHAFFQNDLSTRQLNRTGRANPIMLWKAKGHLARAPHPSTLARSEYLKPHHDESASIADRVRSYMDVNCAGCHQPGGNSRASFDARFETTLTQAGLLNAPLVAGDLGITGARIVVAGSPERSILYQRLKANDAFRMPPVQYHNQASPILPLMKKWIEDLK